MCLVWHFSLASLQALVAAVYYSVFPGERCTPDHRQQNAPLQRHRLHRVQRHRVGAAGNGSDGSETFGRAHPCATIAGGEEPLVHGPSRPHQQQTHQRGAHEAICGIASLQHHRGYAERNLWAFWKGGCWQCALSCQQGCLGFLEFFAVFLCVFFLFFYESGLFTNHIRKYSRQEKELSLL